MRKALKAVPSGPASLRRSMAIFLRFACLTAVLVAPVAGYAKIAGPGIATRSPQGIFSASVNGGLPWG